MRSEEEKEEPRSMNALRQREEAVAEVKEGEEETIGSRQERTIGSVRMASD